MRGVWDVDLGGGRDAVHHGGGQTADFQPRHRGVFRRSHGEGDRIPRDALRSVGISLKRERARERESLHSTDLLQKFLCRDPLARISIDEILVGESRRCDAGSPVDEGRRRPPGEAGGAAGGARGDLERGDHGGADEAMSGRLEWEGGR